MQVSDIIFLDVRRKGISSNLDKKRTILENLRRNANTGNPGIHHIAPDDLRFKTWEDIYKPHSNARDCYDRYLGSWGVSQLTKKSAWAWEPEQTFNITAYFSPGNKIAATTISSLITL
jgi:hypothetical protein